MQVEITRIGPTPQRLTKDILFQFIKIGEGLKVIADSTRDHMRQTISSSKKRSGGNQRLEKNINVHILNNDKKNVDIGVGSIAILNVRAPYWRILNYGGMSGVALQGKAVPGYFGEGNAPDPALSGTGKGHEYFTYVPQVGGYSSSKRFFMTPKHPIAGINYIEKAGVYAGSIVRVHFANWTKQTTVNNR